MASTATGGGGAARRGGPFARKSTQQLIDDAASTDGLRRAVGALDAKKMSAAASSVPPTPCGMNGV
jgi:hypothetical protein